jgi:hypothetical protein
MKKIIAISVMFALITGAVFAQVSVGGNLKIATDLVSSTGDSILSGTKNTKNNSGATIWDGDARLSWSGENSGGHLRLWPETDMAGGKPGNIEWTAPLFAFVWWQPIRQFKILIGEDRDGEWGHAQITGWGYNQEAQGGVAIDEYREIGTNALVARKGAWWPGWNKLGLYISVFPIQEIEINLGIPMGGGGENETSGGSLLSAKDTYLRSLLNINIAVPDIGNLRLAADLMGTNSKDEIIYPNVWFAFYINAIDDMYFELGAALTNEFTDLNFGLGYRLNAGDFTFKARLGLAVPADDEHNIGGGDMVFGIGILPSFNMGAVVLYFNLGLGRTFNPDAYKYDWFINPYVRIPTKAGQFYTGLKFQGDRGSAVNWGLPIGWNIYF